MKNSRDVRDGQRLTRSRDEVLGSVPVFSGRMTTLRSPFSTAMG